MSKINEFIDDQMSEENQDLYLKSLLKEKLNNDYKTRWSQALNDQGVQRSKAPAGEGNIHTPDAKSVQQSPKIGLLLLTGLLFIALLGLGYYFLNSSNDIAPVIDNAQYAELQIKESSYLNPKITKGESTIGVEEAQAIKAFNTQNWTQAIDLYKTLVASEKENSEHRFYLALSYFFNKDYPKASPNFQFIHQAQNLKDSMRQEVNWYFGFNQYLAGDKKQAKKIWSSIQPGEWKYDEAKKLQE